LFFGLICVINVGWEKGRKSKGMKVSITKALYLDDGIKECG